MRVHEPEQVDPHFVLEPPGRNQLTFDVGAACSYKNALGGTLEQRLDLCNTCIRDADEQTRTELVDRVSNGGFDLLWLADIYKSKYNMPRQQAA